MVFAFTARRDKWFVPILIAAAAIPIAFTVVAVVLGWGFLWIPVGVMLTLLAVLIVLNLRSNKAMLAQAAEQRGSSAQIVENMRGDWRVTPGLASTTQLDIVHLVIGKPGVILLGEGDRAGSRRSSGRSASGCPGSSGRPTSATSTSARARVSSRSPSCGSRS